MQFGEGDLAEVVHVQFAEVMEDERFADAGFVNA
jgi:hypothetical protein